MDVLVPCVSLSTFGTLRLNSSSNSFDNGAAPEPTLRTLLKSYFFTKGLLAMNNTMGGTTGSMVTWKQFKESVQQFERNKLVEW